MVIPYILILKIKLLGLTIIILFFFIELEKEFSSYWNSSYLNKGSRSDDSHYDYSNSMYDTSIARIITSIVTLTIDAILTTKSNDPLKMSIRSILRPKMKWIQKEFNELSQEAIFILTIIITIHLKFSLHLIKRIHKIINRENKLWSSILIFWKISP
jgi:hypothetical protein